MGNPNLSAGQVVPGFYGNVDYNGEGAGAGANNRMLAWGTIGATAQRTPNLPFLPSSQQEADDGCERGSDLANAYRAAISQPEAQGAEVWLLPIVAPSAGVAPTYLLSVLGTPTKPGTIQLWIWSRPVPAVGYTTSDTASTIATALASAIQSMLDLPITSAAAVGAAITITHKHKGTTGEDFPFRCNISPAASGITLSPGTIAFATNATGAGSVKVEFGALSVTTAIANADTPTQIAAKVVASFVADSYPLTAAVNTDPTKADLVMVNDKDIRRIRASVITSTGTTANLGSGATSGAGSPTSYTYNGVLGTGAPSLTSALTSLAGLNPFRSWSAPWTDAATLGAIATNIENASNGSITGQKPQHLTVCGFSPSSVDGAIPPATSPNLTSTAPHYAYLWSPDVPVPGFEIAARIAAARAAVWIDTPQKNWNGFRVRGNESAPILLPPTTPSIDAINTALRTYALAPVVRGRSGNLEVVKGRTTSLAQDRRLWAWSAEAQAAFHSFVSGPEFFYERFNGGSLLRYSEPKAPGLFDAASFEEAMKELLRAWELAGHYDGADALAEGVKATPDTVNPFKVSVDYPESPVVDLDQVALTGHFASPAQ